MVCRGVHFALTDEQADRFEDVSSEGDEAIMSFVEDVEEAWDQDWLEETDKAWDAIHRCLTDGKLEYGHSALHDCILGGFDFYDGDDYLINFLDKDEVKGVAEAIDGFDKALMRERYDQIEVETYQGELSDEDFEYTWSWFESLKAFFRKAADAQRAVIFTVSQ